jgi:hypothetical protein
VLLHKIARIVARADRKSDGGSIVASLTDRDVCLSSAAIKNITIDNIQDTFEFVVGGQEYQCPRVLAGFLSPRVCLYHSVDPSITEYVAKTPDFNGEFHSVISLGSGSAIPITRANRDFFLSLSREFGRSDLYISVMEHFDRNFMRSHLGDSMIFDLLSEDQIGRLASEFCVLTRLQLDAIPVSVLCHLLSHAMLMISSEDSLFS